MHTANGLELMGSFRHAALLFVHTLDKTNGLWGESLWTFWNLCQQGGDPHVVNYMRIEGDAFELHYLFENSSIDVFITAWLVIQPIPSSTGSLGYTLYEFL